MKPHLDTGIGGLKASAAGTSNIYGQSNCGTTSTTHLAGSMAANTKNVDVLVIGAGPAALGFLVGAVKQQRFGELI